MFPIDKSISWEGHLSGLISGVILSFFYKNEIQPIVPKPLTDQQHLFLKHFNDEGKFVANLPFLDEDGNLIISEEEE